MFVATVKNYASISCINRIFEISYPVSDITRRHVFLNFITFYEGQPDNGLNKPKHVASVSTNKNLFPNKML
jgi:hypothetical protein